MTLYKKLIGFMFLLLAAPVINPGLLFAQDYATAPAESGVIYGQPVVSQNLEEYFAEAAPNYNRSIIYVFFNNEPCYTCAQAISLIDEAYQRNFANRYTLLLINYENDQENEFIQTYNLSQPLSIVLARVSNGREFGWTKLENPQNNIADPVSFEADFVSAVNNYLGSW